MAIFMELRCELRGDGSSHIEKDKRVADMFEIFAGKKTIPLFTAAKPAGGDNG
ncbi:hypothetical protein [Yersinia kristensenii]|uniref:Uncharacterized protein n=1 Tax=Yersinia kristensenii TaxID=28152 RepID=A0A0T9L9Q0_YERKR|nr:hypothetical protein [Yersinia kristensenii]CNE71093.1 Uncharacterised protein [Yersinia kristensenii]